MKLRKTVHHFFCGCILAIVVIVTVGYYNPFMGFLKGTEFKVLIVASIILLILDVLLLIMENRKTKTSLK